MSVASGTRFGPFEIVAPLGAGGMGEVYKARDTRLDRTVAIKVLPAALASDPEFRERLDREARAISQLDHPHICALYDIGESNGATYLVLQYLEGETLEDRLRRGKLPLPTAIEYGIQISAALARAHRAGIVHRDLKPGNIMLTKSGARLLDFGLARTTASVNGDGAGDNATATRALTGAGTILGTFRYMAPEQVEGRTVDERADVWALGCVLYEMFTGTRPFDGTSPASVLASILTAPVPPLRLPEPHAGADVDRVVRQCLEKDPDARWQSAADVGHALRSLLSSAGDRESTHAAHLWRRPAVYVAGLALLLAGFGLARVLRPADVPVAAPLLKATIVSPPGLTLSPFGSNGVPHFALSPDGSRIAFVAAAPGKAPSLWVRRLDSRMAKEIPGSSDAAAPFWSPDGRSLGFFGQGRLKRIGIDGERPQVLATILDSAGGTWSGDVILVGRASGPLMRVSADGGQPVVASTLQAGEIAHRWPQFLPDGRHFIFSTSGRPSVWLGTLASLTATKLLDGSSTAVVGAPDMLFYVPPGTSTLMGRQFDPASWTFKASAFQVLDGVKYVGGSGYPPASVTPGGLLAYWDGTTVMTDVNWFDREGRLLPTLPTLPPDATTFAISPADGTVAFVRPGIGGPEIWLMNPSGAVSKFSFGDRAKSSPIWSKDGRAVYFTSTEDGLLALTRRELAGSSPERAVGTISVEGPTAGLAGNFFATDWSRDGRTALISLSQLATARDILVFSTDTKKLTPLLQGLSFEVQARFSPDGDRWIAYAANEAGPWEVFVEAFPRNGQRSQVSVDGGSQPEWRADGKELFFVAPDGALMSVDVTPGAEWRHSTPKRLFPTQMRPMFAPYPTTYAVTADGRHFLISSVRRGTAPTISLVTDWRAARAAAR